MILIKIIIPYLETINLVVSIIGFSSIIIAILSYRETIAHNLFNKRKTNFDVIFNCTNRFQLIMQDIGKIRDDNQSKKTIKSYELKSLLISYLELCEEELYHIEKGIIPEEIEESWKSAMIQYLPSKDGSCDEKPRCLYNILSKDQLSDVIDIFKEKDRIQKYMNE